MTPASRFELGGRSLREHAARGTVINALFMIGLSSLALVKGFLVAVFLDRSDYGVWGIVVVCMTTLLWLRDVGIGDKFIQQDDEDQELAFQKAFTLELLVALLSMVVLAAFLPLFAVIYGEWEIVAPGLVVLLILPAAALSTPLWVYYRQMRFLRQRIVQAVDPIVAFVVTVALAATGAGYWSFIIGFLVGAWAMALVAMVNAPVRLRLRREALEGETLRSYASFSWPLVVGGAAGLVLVQATTLATDVHLGIAAVGVVALASNVTQFANRVQDLVTDTLYPAICAVRDRTDVLRESFLKSNRLGMMWGMPFGVGLTLFYADLVDFGIGAEWETSVTLVQAFGLVVAMSQIYFNWGAYFRALGNTRPLAVAPWAAAITLLVVGLPLLFAYDLDGLAAGIFLQTVAHLAVRIYYLHRLFEELPLVRHALSGVLPVIPGALVVLGMRALETGARSLPEAVAELLVFVAVTAAATWWKEAPLLREAFGYLAGSRVRAASTS